MEEYADIHCHMLGNTDDGAADDNEMYAMLDMAYSSGTRIICLTPHFNIQLFGETSVAASASYDKLCAYAAQKYPDMHLLRGNELFYHQSCIEYLNRGECLTLNGSRRVLVDFQFGTPFYEIRAALLDLLNSGYVPVFAHVERYDCIKPPYKTLYELKNCGIYIQMNAASVSGAWGHKLKKKAVGILRDGLADVVASDAHNLTTRMPCLDAAAQVITKYCDADYAHHLLYTCPCRILGIKD